MKVGKHTYGIDCINIKKWSENDVMVQMIRNRCELPELKMTDIREIQKIQTEDYKNIFLYTGDTVSLDIKDISMVLIDACHFEEDVTIELEYLWPRILDGAYIFGDDTNNPGVANSFLKFAKSKDIEVSFYSKCARIKKENPVSIDGRGEGDTLLFPTILHC